MKRYVLVHTVAGEPVISRHKSVEAAVRADAKLQARVKKHNGGSSYLLTAIRVQEGRILRPINDAETEEVEEAKYRVYSR